jgi:extracellular elastinolytic metalloproteinase
LRLLARVRSTPQVVRAVPAVALSALLIAVPTASAARPASEPLRAKPGGFLTAPSNERPVTVALDYVRDHPRTFELDGNDLAGLRLTRSYRSGGGAVHLQWEQVYRGIPVFGPGLRANVAADGQLINVGEGALPDPGVSSIEPRLSALDALLAAARAADAAIAPGHPTAPKGSERATTFTSGDRASLTLFGGDRLAWRVLLRADPTHVYDAVVDANSGESLYRVNMVKEAADDALVFENHPGATVGGTQVTRPLGPWLSETPRTRLIGPNAWVYGDPDDLRDGDGSDPAPATADEIPPGDPEPGVPPVPSDEWTYQQVTEGATQPGQHCPAAGCTWSNFDNSLSWTVNRNQAGTQLFFFVNRYHDYLRDTPGIGFGATSGNFEGADRVQAQVDDGSKTETISGFEDFPDCDHINNAYVIPVPDGLSMFMQVYLWSNACSTSFVSANDVNAADDALIIDHEYTHGMTNRLVTDGAGFPAMNGWQPGAMDEGFADWYSLDYLVGRGLEADTALPGELEGGGYEQTPLRSQPWDCPVGAAASACPGAGAAGTGGYTYGDFAKIFFDGSNLGPEVHADGEIWVETLWDLRTRMIAAHGTTIGISRTRALITDGLRLAPANPTFLSTRDAILQANTNRAFGDSALIWSVFAARGMGYYARTTGNNDIAPVQSFALPPTQTSNPPPPAADTTRPKVTKVSMKRKRFKVGARSAFAFTLSELASVKIGIARATTGRRAKGSCRRATRKLRRRPPCTRYVSVGSLTRLNMRAGARSISFSGRLRGRALKPGAYKATFRATDPTGNLSHAASVSFRIVRR